MTLDDELRSAFAQEAATRIAPPPDPDGLIRGGRVRRRRRNLERAGAGVAAAVLIGAGGYGAPAAGGTPAKPVSGLAPPSGTATPSAPDDLERSKLAPGTYRTFVGTGAAGERIEADFTVGAATGARATSRSPMTSGRRSPASVCTSLRRWRPAAAAWET